MQRDSNETPTGENVNVNVFDDEFEVDDFDGIADGFRPGQSHDREGSIRSERDDGAGHSMSAFRAVAPDTSTSLSRNSTRKSQSRVNPFASPDDETEPPLQRTPSGNFAPLPHRSISSASSSRFAGSNSPRFGAAGMSHPYGVYPQGTVTRTASTATSSTARRQRGSGSRAGPQHPYAMYAQGIDDDDALENDHAAVQSHDPIGFVRLGQTYERRRGPDGEEQDILGAYGHTEQLPPYSRYPEDGPEKAPLIVPEPPNALHSRAPVLGTDPGMELMHAQLQPSPQSMTDESELQRQPSRSSRMSGSLLASARTDSILAKKRWREKTWKEKKKTRVCGLPFYWFVLASAVILFIGAVMGGVFGGFVEGQRRAETKLAQPESTSQYDASLIATPSATSPPTGTFSVALGTPEATQAGCLTIPQQQVAWDCNIAYGGELAINISKPSKGGPAGAFFFNPYPDENVELAYGTQMSQMTSTFSPFVLVVDNDDPQDGHAFFFQTQYDKVVVVPEHAFSDPSSRKFKREPFEIPKAWYGEKQIAGPSDRPWFCFFNQTFVEGYIYTKVPAATPTTSSTITPAPSSSSSSSDDDGYYPSTSKQWPPYTWLTVAPTVTITKTITMSTTTCTYTGVASKLPSWLHDNYPSWNASAYDGGYSSKNKRDNDSGDDASSPPDDNDMPVYPYLMKVEERRVPNSPQPYCVQYQVLDNGNYNWVPDANQQQIVIQLTEDDPPYVPYKPPPTTNTRRARLRRDGMATNPPGCCRCQWMSGQ